MSDNLGIAEEKAQAQRLKSFFEEMKKKSAKEREERESEIQRFGIEKEIAGGLSYRVAFAWHPKKKAKWAFAQ